MAAESFMLFVGADNATGQLDSERIGKILASRHDGYTMWQAEGCWQGKTEPSAVILVSDTRDQVMATMAQLKTELRQDAIGWQTVPSMQFA